MAFAGTTNWEAQTGGDDSANAGGFDAGNTSMATDGAATSATGTAPVFSSASYNFIARDVNAWLYIKSGTNWLPGLYKIASISGVSAVLTATIGNVPQYAGGLPLNSLNTVAGCATTASPTGATWSVDYSQTATAGITFTDMVEDPTTNTKFTSVLNPVGVNMVGNTISVTSGTGFTVQRVQIASVSVITATCDKSLGTLSSTGGHGGLGGCLASPGKMSGLMVGGNKGYLKSGNYACSASANVAAGNLSLPGGGGTGATGLIGYGSVRGDKGTKPVLQASANSQTLITIGNSHVFVDNVTLDGNSHTAVKGYFCDAATSFCTLIRVKATGLTAIGIDHQGVNGAAIINSEITACTTTGPALNLPSAGAMALGCDVHNNTVTGIHLGTNAKAIDCLVTNNTGASSLGIDVSTGSHVVNCTVYGSGSHNIGPMNSGVIVINSYVEGSVAGEGYQSSSVTDGIHLVNSGGFSNFTDNYVVANLPLTEGFQALSGSAFTNAAGGDFSVNNTSGAGMSLRGAAMPTSFSAGPTNNRDVGAAQHADPSGGASLSRVFTGM